MGWNGLIWRLRINLGNRPTIKVDFKAYLAPFLTYLMEIFMKIFNCFFNRFQLFLQQVRSCKFDQVINTTLYSLLDLNLSSF